MYLLYTLMVWRGPSLSPVRSSHLSGLQDQLNSRKIHLATQPSAEVKRVATNATPQNPTTFQRKIPFI